VSVVCPGNIDTPIWTRSEVRGFDRARVNKILSGLRFGDVDACARTILRGVEHDRGIIMVTAEARLMWLAHRVSPRLSGAIHRTLVRKVLAKR
jgi:short-subunit dehydrogenase